MSVDISVLTVSELAAKIETLEKELNEMNIAIVKSLSRPFLYKGINATVSKIDIESGVVYLQPENAYDSLEPGKFTIQIKLKDFDTLTSDAD